jgi:hypothetical protein
MHVANANARVNRSMSQVLMHRGNVTEIGLKAKVPVRRVV